MTSDPTDPPIRPGDRAPNFSLPAGDRDAMVSLADFRGKRGVLVALMRGLQCPFCRRNLALLGATRSKLLGAGVDVLAVVATTPERARLYTKHRLVSIPLAADASMTTHRAYGVPCYPMTPELALDLRAVSVDPFQELAAPAPLIAADGTEIHDTFDRLDGFVPTVTDQEDRTRQFRQGLQLCAQFLIDRDGMTRWVHIEGEPGGLAASGRFPTDAELLAVARSLQS